MEHITMPSYAATGSTSITLGNFDGVHMGHSRLIQSVKNKAEGYGLQSVVLSFDPHPMQYLGDGRQLRFISLPEEKRQLIAGYGIDVFYEYPFSGELASMAPEIFAEEILFKNLKCKYLVTGENYRFGKKRSGDIRLLKKIGQKYDAEVETIPMITCDGLRVSSTVIRELVQSGHGIGEANKLLGRPFSMSGSVISGRKLGRTIGFPTLNIFAPELKVIPKNGVYATTTLLYGKRYMSVTNIGNNLTVGGTYQTIETHVFDLDENLYGHNITIDFLKYLREEAKFSGIDSLALQLSRDVANAKTFFLENRA